MFSRPKINFYKETVQRDLYLQWVSNIRIKIVTTRQHQLHPHTNTHQHTHKHTNQHTHTPTHMHPRTHTHTCTHAQTHRHTHARSHARISFISFVSQYLPTKCIQSFPQFFYQHRLFPADKRNGQNSK